MRRHGLQAPLDPHQLAAWVVFSALASGVYAFFMPFVEDAGVRWFLVALYSVLVLAIIALDFYTSYLDPSDPGLMGATDGEFFCGLCQASVARSSKHCRACDRCVEGFDHHCKWLNNCVGARNYWHFFGLISSTVSLLLMQLAWGMWLFIRSFTDKDQMQRLVADKYGKSVVYGGWQAALATYMALLLTAVLMLGELFFFHIVLISKGMTTYDYIIAQRDAKLAAPSKSSGTHLKGCRSSKVADTATAKRKIRVGLNPFAAMRTSKPRASPRISASVASYDMAKGGKASTLAAVDATPRTTTSPSPVGKPVLDGIGIGSVDSNSSDCKEGMGISDKAAAAGSVKDLVARAVAEQTVFKQLNPTLPSLRETAVLRGLPSPGTGADGGGDGPGFNGPPGSCVPECRDTGREGPFAGVRPTSAGAQIGDFTSLEKARGGQLGGPTASVAAAAAAAELGPIVSPRGASRSPSVRTGSPSIATGPLGLQGFDAAQQQPSGRHLGGHPASPRGLPGPTVSVDPAPGMPSVPHGRVGSLPPLTLAPGLLGLAASGSPGSRSLLFPTKSKSPRGTVAGVVGELPTTPE